MGKIKNLLLLLTVIFSVQGCSTGVSGETIIGRPGSPAWFGSASISTQTSYFSNKCKAYGFKASTNEMAQCIQKESNEARSRIIARERKSAQDSKNRQINRRIIDIEDEIDMRDVQTNLEKLMRR